MASKGVRSSQAISMMRSNSLSLNSFSITYKDWALDPFLLDYPKGQIDSLADFLSGLGYLMLPMMLGFAAHH